MWFIKWREFTLFTLLGTLNSVRFVVACVASILGTAFRKLKESGQWVPAPNILPLPTKYLLRRRSSLINVRLTASHTFAKHLMFTGISSFTYSKEYFRVFVFTQKKYTTPRLNRNRTRTQPLNRQTWYRYFIVCLVNSLLPSMICKQRGTGRYSGWHIFFLKTTKKNTLLNC